MLQASSHRSMKIAKPSPVALLIAALTVVWAASMFHWPLAAQTAKVEAESGWIEAGKGGRLPGEMTFADPEGRLGVLMTSGALDTHGAPVLHAARHQRPRLCDVSSAGQRDEPLGAHAARAVARDQRPRSGLRRD